MKVLYNSRQIRNAIRKIFSKGKGRRVVLAAFVGADAPAFLPNPKGIELVCWPNGAGTNPDAIRELRKLKVKVMFSPRMHTKLYWSQGIGAVVASANLSKNALGEGNLHELGVLIPAEAIDIKALLKSIRPQKVTARSLRQLDKDYYSHRKRNPKFARTSRLNFMSWYKSEARRNWKLACYEKGNPKLPPSMRPWLRAEGGAIRHTEVMSTPGGLYKDDDWILCFTRTKSGKPKSLEWMYAHKVSKVPVSERNAFNDGSPFQVIQVYPTRVYGSPPFHARDSKLGAALREYLSRNPRFAEKTKPSHSDIEAFTTIYRRK
jgi:hypothetical protein